MLKVSQILASKAISAVYAVAPTQMVIEALELMTARNIGAVMVMEGDRLAGIFSERDIVYGIAKYGAAFLVKTVRETMTAPAITVTTETAILSALSLMTKRRIRHLPVIENGQLTGFVSIGDLVKYRIEKIEAEAAAMRDYIQMA